jgi:hypothetical protein
MFERRHCRRNRSLGAGFGRDAKPPSEFRSHAEEGLVSQRRLFLLAVSLWLASGCTNVLYQGEVDAQDAYLKERHFVLYWTKTDPLLGQAKAGPAILLTECSPLTRIEFDDQPEGIVFRGMPGFDLLPEQAAALDRDQICGKVINYTKLREAHEGPLTVAMYCRPVPGDSFAVQPRNYLAARSEPYSFPIVEKMKRWSLFGETLSGPPLPACRQ